MVATDPIGIVLRRQPEGRVERQAHVQPRRDLVREVGGRHERVLAAVRIRATQATMPHGGVERGDFVLELDPREDKVHAQDGLRPLEECEGSGVEMRRSRVLRQRALAGERAAEPARALLLNQEARGPRSSRRQREQRQQDELRGPRASSHGGSATAAWKSRRSGPLGRGSSCGRRVAASHSARRVRAIR